MAENPHHTFMGRGWKFPPTFSKQKRRAEMVENEEDIHEALHIILLTTRGERIMQPDFGCDVKRFVFDEITTTRITKVAEDIRKAILFGEPRVICESVTPQQDPEQDGLVYFKVTYVIRTTNNRRNIVFPFYIEEGTNVKLIQENS